jgi:sterol desaturase/sphingolipid hydroxylase (fatty acid hydroxylase superfamily)
LGIALFCFVLERVAPGWPLPKVKTWPFRVVAVNLVQLGVVLLAGLSWERWLSSASLFHLQRFVSPSVGGAIYTFCTAVGEFFYHTNVKTPQWVGYIFQRPEMHRIHHEYARHQNNYGDIVWWDMMFGTYENPKEFKTSCGFDDEKEQSLIPMLQFKDVHK